MKTFRADLHIHTVLSPCGDLEMSPANIVRKALEQHLDIIAITDHNSTRHCRVVHELGSNFGLTVIGGAEVTTREEAHCLALFPDFERLDEFQKFLDAHLPDIPNDPGKFGDQVQTDKDENIIYEETRLLISAIDRSIEDVERQVHKLGGLFIPAHIDRQTFGLISQLGFVPDDLDYEALEISKHISKMDFLKLNPYLENATFIRSSDAHFIQDVGSPHSIFHLEKPTFEEIRMALKGEKGRGVETEG